jgi:hypothetical protein
VIEHELRPSANAATGVTALLFRPRSGGGERPDPRLELDPLGALGRLDVDPGANAGTSAKLVVDNSPINDFVVKFAVATTGCSSVTSATLRLTDYANGSVKGGDIYATGTGWSEGTVTYGNAPPRAGRSPRWARSAPGRPTASMSPRGSRS